MPLSDDKKIETRDRINRDPEFRDEFLTSALEPQTQPEEGPEQGEADEIGIFERLLAAYDNQSLLEEKEASTIN